MLSHDQELECLIKRSRLPIQWLVGKDDGGDNKVEIKLNVPLPSLG